MASSDPPSAGQAASAFIAEEMETERGRKASLESRGLAVITTSGTLVTLLFGLATFAASASQITITASERWLLTVAALLFVVAAGLGIACNAPIRYYQVDAESLAVFMTPEVWVEPGVDATRELTAARLTELSDARGRNEHKGQLVVAAMCLQVIAGLLTAIAIAFVLWNA